MKKRLPSHIFYDYDGTLGDSLPQHIHFLHDMNSRFKTGLELPPPNDYEACKKLIGIPMEVFIKNAGFPEELIPEILKLYGVFFPRNKRYKADLFPQIPEVIATLFDEGFYQSIISSNFSRNWLPSIQKAGLEHIFLYKIGREKLDSCGRSKGRYMMELSDRLDLSSREFIYVGDTESDYQAAQQAEVVFVGVSYGWQISPDDTRFPNAKNPDELFEILVNM